MFQVHGIDERGKAVLKKQLKRAQMAPFFVKLPPSLIGMDRGVIGCPAGLLQQGLHALLMSRLWYLTVSNRAGRPPLPSVAPATWGPPQGVNVVLSASRLERLPGGIRTHWKAPPCHGADPEPTFSQ